MTLLQAKLQSGADIAVKRLSLRSKSKEGVEQFKTKVQLLVKLQHINLVRLVGCCVQRRRNCSSTSTCLMAASTV